MHVLVTGHTGFKGAWLTLLLSQRGHTVSGLALDPIDGALFATAGLGELLVQDHRVDIRDEAAVAKAVAQAAPDVVIHLAAQPLVRESYEHPRLTFETNAMGTLNILEAVNAVPSIAAHLVITTDKVYRNVDKAAGYREDEPLGGHDPYSASKAMADILTQSWVASYPGPPTAIARGGNVIGGGDVSKDRLLPDLLASFRSGGQTSIRYPAAVRPWQHVLDCLNGYLDIVAALLDGRGTGAWNIGPGAESFVPVGELADHAAAVWGGAAGWRDTSSPENVHEANLLALDATRAREELGWVNRLPYPQSVEWTIAWQKAVDSGIDARAATVAQIHDFEAQG